MRHCGKWRTDETRFVRDALAQFDKIDECEGILRYGREYGEDKTRLIIIPGTSLRRSGQNTRSDIVWMWKDMLSTPLADNARVKIGADGMLTILHTTESDMYIVSKNTDIAESWAEAEWAWAWIQYVCSETIGAQKKGKLREKLPPGLSLDKKLARTLRLIHGTSTD